MQNKSGTMRAMVALVSFVVIGVGFSTSLLGETCAQYAVGANPGDLFSAYALEGKLTSTGNLHLRLRPGPIATKAIKVYSQPSDALLLFATTTEFAGDIAGQEWIVANVEEEVSAVVTTEELPGTEINAYIPGRPASDDRISVWVYGCWPDGTEEERLIADGRVGAGDFGFSSSVPVTAVPEDPVHCCSGGGCQQMCIDCQGPRFTCCLLYPDCSIHCGLNKCE